MTDDYAVDNTQMQSTADPGEVGSESRPTTLAGELERLRFALKELKQWCLGTIAQWYESPTAQAVISEDARTNSVATGLTVTRTTTGVVAAGIGTRLLLRGESADEVPSDFGALDFVASDIGAGTEDTYASIALRVAGRALDEKYRFQSTAGDGFTAVFAHAVTADRTYTLPDSDATLGGDPLTLTTAAPSPPAANTLYKDNVPKFWLRCGVAADITDSFNITSLTDTSTGIVTVTIDRDFANTTYVVNGLGVAGSYRIVIVDATGIAAGSFQANCFTVDTNGAGVLTDPTTWMLVGFGDQ